MVLFLVNSGFAKGNQQSVRKSERTQNAVFVSPSVVISEVYGGAGCGTAGCSTYKNDYIELFNNSSVAVNVNGWSVQYASATGTTWQVTVLSGTIQPKSYYLVGESGPFANGVNSIPTPNASGSIAMSATAGKVALVNSNVQLTGACPTGDASIVDFIGYGTAADCAESSSGTVSGSSRLIAMPTAGQTAPAPSTTTSVQRTLAADTYLDTDNNGTDYTANAPNPQAASVATAASVSVVGRVMTRNGKGIRNVLVRMVDESGEVRTVLTSAFGYYRFTDVPAGQSYTISVSAKKYTFIQAAQVFSLFGERDDVDFIAAN